MTILHIVLIATTVIINTTIVILLVPLLLLLLVFLFLLYCSCCDYVGNCYGTENLPQSGLDPTGSKLVPPLTASPGSRYPTNLRTPLAVCPTLDPINPNPRSRIVIQSPGILASLRPTCKPSRRLCLRTSGV